MMAREGNQGRVLKILIIPIKSNLINLISSNPWVYFKIGRVSRPIVSSRQLRWFRVAIRPLSIKIKARRCRQGQICLKRWAAVGVGVSNNRMKIEVMRMGIMLYCIVLILMTNRYKLARAQMMISFIFHRLVLVLIIMIFKGNRLALKFLKS